jgi:hypothetical protein
MKSKFLNYLICYIFWAISSSFAIYLVLVARSFYLKIMPFLTRNIWAINFWDKLFIVLIATIGLCFIIGLESYYQKGMKKNKLFARFFLITGIEILILFMLQNIPLFLYGFNFSIINSLLKFGQLIFGLFLIVISQRNISSLR